MSQHDVSEEMARRCHTVVDQLIARYHWQLLEHDEFVQRVLGHMHAGVSEQLVHAAIGAYCVAMHTACSGAEGPLRQNQAYGELAHYLYSLAYMRFADLLPDAREDVTQSALERIFKSFDRCREPIAFLAFAAQHLLDAVRVVRRQEHRAVQSLAQPSGQSDEALADVLQDDKPQPDEHIIAEEQRTAIEKLLLEYSQMHPRATQQIAVLRMKWIDDLDEGEIGQRLGISINSVYVAQSRIAKTMRSEPHWRARAVALGILLDEL